MKATKNTNSDGSLIVPQFYHSHAFRYLIEKRRNEIRQRLTDAPNALRQRNLIPKLQPLGEVGGDNAWQVFRNYLDSIEYCIAEIVRGQR